MRVCLDARCLRKTVTGLGRYAEELIRALAAIDRTTEYVVILGENYEGTVVEQENFSFVRLPGRPDTLGNVLSGARRIERIGADLYHSLHHFLPFGIKGRTLLTLHDLMLLEYPDMTFPRRWKGYAARAYAQITIKYAVRRADHVIAISPFTAQRAKALTGLPLSRVTVIPHGVEERFFRAGNGAAGTNERVTMLQDAKGSRFFLVVGHCKPYKNGGRIVEAFALLAERIPDIQLRFVGRGEGYDQLREQAAALGVEHRVRFLRNVPDEELLGMYGAALALVMPSLVEGFGLPVLEAQAAGCPVITSNRDALAETAGDVAVLVDPLDSRDIARAMARIYGDGKLRASLGERGRERAKRFTWETTASRTRAVYDLLMAQPEAEADAVGKRRAFRRTKQTVFT